MNDALIPLSYETDAEAALKGWGYRTLVGVPPTSLQRRNADIRIGSYPRHVGTQHVGSSRHAGISRGRANRDHFLRGVRQSMLYQRLDSRSHLEETDADAATRRRRGQFMSRLGKSFALLQLFRLGLSSK